MKNIDQIKVDLNKVEGALLNWLVAFSLPNRGMSATHVWLPTDDGEDDFLIPNYCGDWNVGGPLSEAHRVSVEKKHDGWWMACIYNINDEPECGYYLAHSELVAKMRCVVASYCGAVVTVPADVLYEHSQVKKS